MRTSDNNYSGDDKVERCNTTDDEVEALRSPSHQHEQDDAWLLLTLAVSCRVCALLATPDDGSASKLSDILSQMMSTSRSKTALTLTLSFADVSKNSKPIRAR